MPMADTAELVDLLPTFYKQRNANFFPAWCFGVAQVALRVPWILMDSTVWSLIVYFSVGYVKSARFLVFWATCFLSALFGLTLFAAIGGICRVQTTTSAVESFLLLVFVNAAGFVITPSSIPGGWKGAYYANPWSYWIQGLAVNEFTSADWSMPMPGGNGSTVGEAILQSR